MLIAQVFIVVFIYRLRSEQHRYHENVINFSWDIHEFTTRLLRQQSSLDIFVIQQQIANELTAFRDFIVRRRKVASTLLWLKEHNQYYEDITIDNKILQSLSKNRSIFNNLS